MYLPISGTCAPSAVSDEELHASYQVIKSMAQRVKPHADSLALVEHYLVDHYFNPKVMRAIIAQEEGRQQVFRKYAPEYREQGEVLIWCGPNDIRIPLYSFESKDKGRINTLLYECQYPELADFIYTLFSCAFNWDTCRGRPDAVVVTSHGDAHTHYTRELSQQWRSVQKCLKAIEGRRLRQTELSLYSNEDIDACVRANTLHHISRECGQPLPDEAADYYATLTVVPTYKYMCLELDGSLVAVVEYSEGADVLYWHNTYLKRTPEALKLGIGNYAVFLLMKEAYRLKLDLNLGISLIDYKEVYKPKIVYSRCLDFTAHS